MYKNNRLVIKLEKQRQQIIRDVHQGIGDNCKAKAMASHRGRDTTYQKCSERFFWHNMRGDIAEFVKRCETCQKHGKMEKSIAPELQSVPVPSEVMKQIGIDICNLPEVDGYKHLVVCIDYFSKWSEAKPIKDKLAESVSNVLYEIICRHGCMRIQINDQGREFVNEVIENLHEMTGVEQRITSAYHPQSNGLCERQNRNIKESLVKVLDAKPSEWPYVIEGVLFAHRVSKHSSTKFSPFFLMYNRKPVLPVDIQYNLDDTENAENDDPFNMEVFNTILSSTLSLREEAHQEASKNIVKAQEKQQKDYNRRHTGPTSFKIKDKVWLKNQRRQDRKGGKFSYKWTGPYTIEHITKTGLCTLRNERSATVLAKKFNVGLLKPYLDPPAEDPQDEEKQHTVPPDEKPASIQSEDCIQTEVSKWRNLPNEIVEMILVLAVRISKEPLSTFNHLSLTSSTFNKIMQKNHYLLPTVHIQFSKTEYQRLSQYNGKIKVSVRKITNLFGKNSGVCRRILEVVNNKKWKSSWLILESDGHSMYRICKVYWKAIKNPITIKDEPSDAASNTDEQFWVCNELYYLKNEDAHILNSETAWLNDRIMDAVQRLICETLGEEDNYQSVLNTQKDAAIPFNPVYNDHIQLLHDGSSHWFLSFCSSGRVQICDSLKSKLNRSSMKSVYSLYKYAVGEFEKVKPTFLPVHKQRDGFNCGPFAIAYAAEILDGKSPMEAKFIVPKMRSHLKDCLEKKLLTPFPKVNKL